MLNVSRTLMVVLSLLILTPLTASDAISAEAKGKTLASSSSYVYFTNIRNNAQVRERFTAYMTVRNMEVVSSSKKGDYKGHFHVLVDGKINRLFDKPLVTLKNATDLRRGQNKITLNLTKGVHTLQIVMGDHGHMLHNPPIMSTPITVYVGVRPPRTPPRTR